jgi:hypothetical protein
LFPMGFEALLLAERVTPKQSPKELVAPLGATYIYPVKTR